MILDRAANALVTRYVHRSYLRFLERAPWDDASAMAQLQMEHVRTLSQHAVASVPFQTERFERAGIAPDDLRTPDDLLALPPVDKRVLREAGDDAHDSGPAASWQTSSGSTGEPFFFAHHRWFDARTAAVRSWFYRTVGVDSGPVFECFAGSDVRRIRSSNSHDVHVLGYDAPRAEQLAMFPSVRPRVVYGGRSFLLELGDDMTPAAAVSVEGVVSTGEILTATDRDDLAHRYGCRVHDVYGLSEVGIAAVRRHGESVYRMVSPRVMVEVLVDDRPAQPGETGDVVVTSLDNLTMPFLRYPTGDRATLADDSPASGHPDMLIAHIDGRREDQLWATDGRPVTWTELAGTMWWEPAVRNSIAAFRVVQEDLGFVRVLLVPADDDVPPSVMARIRRSLASALHEPRLEIETVERLPELPGGKHRPLVSNLGPTDGDPR